MIAQLQPADFARQPKGETPLLVLDVREPWEVQTASVKEDGFRLLQIPMREVPARLAEIESGGGLDQPIVCLCHHGMRSQQVALYLSQNGFTDVANLTGGIAAWSSQVDPSVPQY